MQFERLIYYLTLYLLMLKTFSREIKTVIVTR